MPSVRLKNITRGCNGFDNIRICLYCSVLAALTASRLSINGRKEKTTEELANDVFFANAASQNSLAFA